MTPNEMTQSGNSSRWLRCSALIIAVLCLLFTVLWLWNRQTYLKTECRGEDNLCKTKENLWLYLAKTLNLTDFCLQTTLSASNILETCLVAVPTPVAVWTGLLRSQWNDTDLEDHDVKYGYVNPYHACYDCPTYENLQSNMIEVITGLVTAAEICYNFTCDETLLPPCIQAKMQNKIKPNICDRDLGNCKKIISGKNMQCNITKTVPSLDKHVPLPAGWVLACGNTSYTYIPANITEGPCTIARLTLAMLPLFPAMQTRHTRDTSLQLPENCDYNVNLLSRSEYMSLGVSLIGVPGLAIYNHRTISKLACYMVKQINVTSAILQDMLLDIQSYKKAILQNRATIDYLLLQHGVGCSAFAGMCCFNLSDHSRGIKDTIGQLEEMRKHKTRC